MIFEISWNLLSEIKDRLGHPSEDVADFGARVGRVGSCDGFISRQYKQQASLAWHHAQTQIRKLHPKKASKAYKASQSGMLLA